MLENLKARLGTRTLVLLGTLAVLVVFAAAFVYLSATKPAKVKTLAETEGVPAPTPIPVEQPVQKFDAAPAPQAVNGSGLPGAPESPTAPVAKADGPKEIPITPQAPAVPAPQTAKPGPSEIPVAPAAKPAAPAPTQAAPPPAKPAATVQAPAIKAPTAAPAAPALAPAKTAPTAAPVGASAGSTFQYVYQVASYKDAAPAQHDKDRLDKAGVKAKVEQAEVNGGTWNRVRAEFTGSADQLKEFTAKLRQAGFKDYIQISKTPAK